MSITNNLYVYMIVMNKITLEEASTLLFFIKNKFVWINWELLDQIQKLLSPKL